jgi:hypothetical protein
MKDLSSAEKQTSVIPAARSVEVQWNCKILEHGSKVDTPLADPLTVGKKFSLKCEGPPVSLSRDGLRLEMAKNHEWSLRLLEVVSIGDTGADLVATTWVTGDLEFENPILTDGINHIGLGKMSLSSASVITQESNPEGKPFPPWGPLAIPWPVWIWGIVGALLVALGFALWLAIRQSLRRRRLLAELEKHTTVLSPYNQFNKELRRIGRQLPHPPGLVWSKESSVGYFRELNSIFRWYLARELIVPAFEESPGQVLRELRRSHRELYAVVGRELKLALLELKKAIEAKDGASLQDAHQLAEMCRKLANQITQLRSA